MAQVARFEMPDGRIGRFEVPDGTTPEQAQAMIQAEVSRSTEPTRRSTDIASQIPGLKPAAPRPLTNDNPNFIDRAITNYLANNPRVANAIERTAGQGSQFGRFVQGAADLPVGVMQLGMNAVGQGDLANQEIAAINQRTEQLRGADAGTADWWRFGGAMTNPLPLKAALAIKSAPTAIGRIGQAAGVGVLSGIQPITKGDYAEEATGNALASGALSALIPGGIETGRAIGTAAGNIIGPILSKEGAELAAGRVARKVAGDRTDEVIANLQTANRNVNAGQAALPAGSAEFSALQAAANRIKPSEAVALEATQAGRRAGAIERIAGGADNTKMNTAIALRESVTKPMYKASEQSTKPIDVSNIVAQVDDLIARKPGNKELVTELNSIKDGLLKSSPNFGFGPSTTAAKPEQVVSVIDGIKAAIAKKDNKFIQENLLALRDQLKAITPGMTQADAAFRQLSGPINRMEVGREMQKKLASAIGEKPGTYLNTLNDAAQVLKTATGFNRYNNLGEVLTPREMKVVNAVGQQLENEIRLRTLARAGAQKTSKITGEALDSVPQFRFLNNIATTINAITRRLETGAGEKSMEALADMMIGNPKYLAKIMIEAKPAERSAIIDGLIKLQAVPVGTSVGQ